MPARDRNPRRTSDRDDVPDFFNQEPEPDETEHEFTMLLTAPAEDRRDGNQG
jgi:hypothetical protein